MRDGLLPHVDSSVFYNSETDQEEVIQDAADYFIENCTGKAILHKLMIYNDIWSALVELWNIKVEYAWPSILSSHFVVTARMQEEPKSSQSLKLFR